MELAKRGYCAFCDISLAVAVATLAVLSIALFILVTKSGVTSGNGGYNFGIPKTQSGIRKSMNKKNKRFTNIINGS